MICLGCKHSYMEDGIECQKGRTPQWDEDAETEVCVGYQRRTTKEEIEEIRAEEEISWRRDNGL